MALIYLHIFLQLFNLVLFKSFLVTIPPGGNIKHTFLVILNWNTSLSHCQILAFVLTKNQVTLMQFGSF